MWAILFDLKQDELEDNYIPPSSYKKAYTDIKNFLKEKGFDRKQGSVYFGNKNIEASDCFIVIDEIVEKYSWFFPSIRDIRILKIEDNNDLYKFTERSHGKYHPIKGDFK